MTKRTSVESRPSQVVAFLRRNGPSKMQVIAAGVSLDAHQTSMALGCAKERGLVVPSCKGRHAVWSVVEPVAAVEEVKTAAPQASSAPGQVAAMREAPPFRALDEQSALRAGAAFRSTGLPMPGLGGRVGFGGVRFER